MRIGRFRSSSETVQWCAVVETATETVITELAEAAACLAVVDTTTGRSVDGDIDLVELLSTPSLMDHLAGAWTHAQEHAHGWCEYAQSTMDAAWTPQPLIDRPRKLMGVGANFPSHIDEARRSGAQLPDPVVPVLFSKAPTTMSGDGDAIRIPPYGTQLDYEVELAVVIGTECRDVASDQAREVIAGITVVNDMSLRDVLFHAPNGMFEGKNYDGFLPMASTFITLDECGDLADLTLWSTVNDAIRQKERSVNAIFSPEEIVSFASSRMTLQPGDVLFCGTPAGVGIFADDKDAWLLSGGDVVEVGIDSLVKVRSTIENLERK